MRPPPQRTTCQAGLHALSPHPRRRPSEGRGQSGCRSREQSTAGGRWARWRTSSASSDLFSRRLREWARGRLEALEGGHADGRDACKCTRISPGRKSILAPRLRCLNRRLWPPSRARRRRSAWPLSTSIAIYIGYGLCSRQETEVVLPPLCPRFGSVSRPLRYDS